MLCCVGAVMLTLCCCLACALCSDNQDQYRRLSAVTPDFLPTPRVAHSTTHLAQPKGYGTLRVRKIDAAVLACKHFIDNVHCGGDRGIVACFNDNFRICQRLTNNVHSLKLALDSLRPDGGTNFYESLKSLVAHMNLDGSGRPKVIIAITDGNDTTGNSVHSCAQYVYNNFERDATNFTFVIAVGRDIEAHRFQPLAATGKINVMHFLEFAKVEAYFMLIALQLCTRFSVAAGSARIGEDNVSWAAIRQQRMLVKQDVDYAFLIDVSGSMSDPAL